MYVRAFFLALFTVAISAIEVDDIVVQRTVTSTPCVDQVKACEADPGCVECFENFETPHLTLRDIETCRRLVRTWSDNLAESCERTSEPVTALLTCAAGHFFEKAYDGMVAPNVCGDAAAAGDETPTAAPTTAPTAMPSYAPTPSPTKSFSSRMFF